MTGAQRMVMNRVLIVEDNLGEREGLRALLQASGFSVKTAVDGVEGLEQLQQGEFDLLLLDIWMPRMSGLDLLSCLPENSQLKVIVMTADDAPETVLKSLRKKAYQFITKPFVPKELIEVIRTALKPADAAGQIEVLSAEPRWVELLFPCNFQTAERIQGFLRQLEADLPKDVRESVDMAFHELLMNAVEWGGRSNADSKIRVACLRTNRLLLYRIADPGKGFKAADLEHAAIRNSQDEPYEHTGVRDEKGIRPGGFGILLAKSLVDELVYNEACNEVAMVKYLDLSGPSAEQGFPQQCGAN
jgi:DNA-binding response OmpR family regulator